MPNKRWLHVAAAVLLSSASCRAPERDEPDSGSTAEAKFEPTWESIRTHQVPEWYQDAKLGIFVHWGLYSVPAWATPSRSLDEVVDWENWFTDNAYAEWYMNTLRIDGSPTQKHHYDTYGEDFDYMDFVPMFNEALERWDPGAMAELFAEVNARYVVLTSKHHDGFTLWPSDVSNPNRPDDRQGAARDVVGELGEAVRARGMRMGYYYSGGLDWSFNPKPVVTRNDVWETIIHDPEYARYADAHWRELIDRYHPDILWNDIGYPETGDLAAIVADYYNRFPDGLINNRFEIRKEGAPARHHDFVTPEYSKMEEITDYKWEACRGLGYSFGYNQVEGPEQTIAENELIYLLVDIVSKNGNLLLNVGPMADGTIPEIQASRLLALGAWLDVNGEAIFDTRPWERAAGETADGLDVRFTRKGDDVYAVVLGKPSGGEMTIRDLTAPEGASVTLLGGDALAHRNADGALIVSLPETMPEQHAYAFRLAID